MNAFRRYGVALLAMVTVSACALRPGTSPQSTKGANAETNATVAKLLDAAATANEENDTEKFEGSVAAIALLGEPAISQLSAAHADAREDVRLAAVLALAKLNTSATVEPLLAALKDESSEVRTEAVRALGELRDRRAVQPLIEQAQSDDTPSVRYDSLNSLGLIGDPAARPLLLNGTHADDRYVRMWSMTALCKMRDEAAADLAVTLIRDPELYVRRQVLLGCEEMLDTPQGHQAVIDLALSSNDFLAAALARRDLRNYRQKRPEENDLTEAIRAAGRAALKDPPRAVNAALWDPLESTCRHASLSIL